VIYAETFTDVLAIVPVRKSRVQKRLAHIHLVCDVVPSHDPDRHAEVTL
jgi:hypothetical protein